MASFKRLSILAAGAAILVTSGAEARPRDRHGPERGIDSLNQPVVERSDYVLDLPASSGSLSAVEKARLRGWFDGLGVGYGDEVFVEEGYGRGPGTADVASVAAEYGLLLSDGAPVTQGSVGSGTVRVIVTRSIAYVPDCPSGAKVSGPSSTSPNYGCGVNSNWAAMVANPSDLVLGQTGTVGASRDAGIKAIKVYREAPPTGTKGLPAVSTSGRGN